MQGKLRPRHSKAAVLVARGQSQDAVASAIGVHEMTIARWMNRPAFVAAVEAEAAAIRAQLRTEGIGERQNRLDAQNERWQALRRVIAERAADPALAEVPGGTTGLIVAKPVLVKVYQSDGERGGGGGGERLTPVKQTELVSEYAVDTATLKELRELEKQAAIELGQWTEKREEKHDFSEFLAALREFGQARVIEGRVHGRLE